MKSILLLISLFSSLSFSQQSTQNSDEIMETAISYFNSKQYNESLIYVKQALKIDPKNYTALDLASLCYHNLRDLKSAKNYLLTLFNFKRLYNESWDFNESYIRLTNYYVIMGALDSAAYYYSFVEDNYKTYFNTYYIFLAFTSKLLDEAIASTKMKPILYDNSVYFNVPDYNAAKITYYLYFPDKIKFSSGNTYCWFSTIDYSIDTSSIHSASFYEYQNLILRKEVKSYYEFNCSNSTMTLLNSIEYDEKGEIIDSYDKPFGSPKTIIIPGSIDESIADYICKKHKSKKR